MRRLTVLSALLLIVSLAVPLVAQQVANVDTNSSATFTRGQMELAQAHFGTYNIVSWVKRDCTPYAKDVRTGFLHLRHKHVIDTESCNADPSTITATYEHHNLTTNAGKDFIKAQISGTATTANCAFIAVGTTAITPAATDTTLTGEATTNGLGRASGTYSSTGTGTFTLTHQFTDITASTSNVQAAAVFNASSSGTMCFEVGSLGPVTLNVNDTLTVTWSGTISKLLQLQRFGVVLDAEPSLYFSVAAAA